MRCEGTVGIPLESMQGNRHSSRSEVGNTGLFLSCGGKLGIPLELRQVYQRISGVPYRQSSLLSSYEGEHGTALGSLLGNRASSCVEKGISWFFLSCCQKLGVPLKLHQGPQGTSGNLSCCHSGVRPPFELQGGTP